MFVNHIACLAAISLHTNDLTHNYPQFIHNSFTNTLATHTEMSKRKSSADLPESHPNKKSKKSKSGRPQESPADQLQKATDTYNKAVANATTLDDEIVVLAEAWKNAVKLGFAATKKAGKAKRSGDVKADEMAAEAERLSEKTKGRKQALNTAKILSHKNKRQKLPKLKEDVSQAAELVARYQVASSDPLKLEASMALQLSMGQPASQNDPSGDLANALHRSMATSFARELRDVQPTILASIPSAPAVEKNLFFPQLEEALKPLAKTFVSLI